MHGSTGLRNKLEQHDCYRFILLQGLAQILLQEEMVPAERIILKVERRSQRIHYGSHQRMGGILHEGKFKTINEDGIVRI